MAADLEKTREFMDLEKHQIAKGFYAAQQKLTEVQDEAIELKQESKDGSKDIGESLILGNSQTVKTDDETVDIKDIFSGVDIGDSDQEESN